MLESFDARSRLLIGDSGAKLLAGKSVLILGLGGVGGACAEAICRAGVGKLILVDNDHFELTNLNRQILAVGSNLGQKKCEVARQRFMDINPEAEVVAYDLFCTPANCKQIFAMQPSYIADCCDVVSTKVFLASECEKRGIPLASCLGMGNRLDPSKIRYGSVWDTAGSGCAIAQVMRQKLRVSGTSELDVVFSVETPKTTGRVPGSISFVPPVAGYLLAAKIINSLLSS